MEPKRLPLNLPPGLFQAGTIMQAEGRWYDGHLVRFFEKTVRSVGGWRRLVDVNSVVIPPVGGNGESGGSGSGATPRKVIAWAAGGATSARFMAVGAVGPVSEAEGGPGDGSDNKAHHLYVYREGIKYDITPDDLADAYDDSEGEWVEASGGDDVYDEDGFRYHVFLSNGTFTITEPGRCEVLVVGGGGGAGATVENVDPDEGEPSRYAGGGGGGGEVVQVADIPFEAGAFPVIVGAGGVAAGDGGTSSINDIEAAGGEGGVDGTLGQAGQGGPSGSGNLGGDIGESGFYGGGGGGDGGQGGTGDNAGFGGNGTSPTMYTVDALGRGGNGGRGDQLPGLANTGEGGDAVHNSTGAVGGSGIVVIRYRTN